MTNWKTHTIHFVWRENLKTKFSKITFTGFTVSSSQARFHVLQLLIAVSPFHTCCSTFYSRKSVSNCKLVTVKGLCTWIVLLTTNQWILHVKTTARRKEEDPIFTVSVRRSFYASRFVVTVSEVVEHFLHRTTNSHVRGVPAADKLASCSCPNKTISPYLFLSLSLSSLHYLSLPLALRPAMVYMYWGTHFTVRSALCCVRFDLYGTGTSCVAQNVLVTRKGKLYICCCLAAHPDNLFVR